MTMGFFVHPNALVESKHIGDGTRIWAFAHILPGAVLGRDCNICDHTFIENKVVIGDRVTVKCGVQIWDGVRLEDDVFVGPNATFSNDRFPRSKKHDRPLEETFVKKGASIGANATILPGISIGQYAMVGAGSVVVGNVPPYAIVVGNPGRITGYDISVQPTSAPRLQDEKVTNGGRQESKVRGVSIICSPVIEDLRGNLIARENGDNVPFEIKRIFSVYNVPSKHVRGEHAHRQLHQLLVPIHGSISVLVDDGENRESFYLNSPHLGLYIPPMIWSVQYNYSSDAILVVLASDIYRPEDYIRDYDEFLNERSHELTGAS